MVRAVPPDLLASYLVYFGDPARAPSDPNLFALQLAALEDMRTRCATPVIMLGRCRMPEGVSVFGSVLGPVLKFASKIVAFWPGIGTGISVALAAGAALAMNERIDDAAIDLVSSALPPGPIQVTFDASSRVTRDVIEGRNPTDSILEAARGVAGQTGGDVAVAALDEGVSIARGNPVSPEALARLRAQVAMNGPGAAAAFDLGLGIGRGDQAKDIVIAMGRNYLEQAGGKSALVAFDAGYALAQGKALQEAGFTALRSFVAGNNAGEKAETFVEKIAEAATGGRGLQEYLEDQLVEEFGRAGSMALDEAIERLQLQPELAELGSMDLAQYLGTAEVVARAAQAVLRDGQEDRPLHFRLLAPLKTTTTETNSLVQSVAAAFDRLGLRTTTVAADSGLAARAAVAFDPLGLRTTSVHATSSLAQNVAEAFGGAMAISRPAAPLVQAAPSQGSRSTVGQDIALAVVIAAAGGALLWWARGVES